MKNIRFILSSLLILAISSSCDKEVFENNYKDLLVEAVDYDAMVYLKTSDYKRVEAEELINSGECSEYYAGAIEYYEKGDLSARIDFSNMDDDGKNCGGDKSEDNRKDRGDEKDEYESGCGDKDNEREARCVDQRGERVLKFRKEKGQGSKYEKVVVEPLVKSEDCDNLVAGTICFYEAGEWVATVDFGDGTCDGTATKTTKEGTKAFDLKDKKKWGK